MMTNSDPKSTHFEVPEASEPEIANLIAYHVARELVPGSVVNLGRGIPQLVSRFTVDITFFGENGTIGYGPYMDGHHDVEMIDGGCKFASPRPGMSFVDSATSFAIIRGGHIDVTVMGALQVSGNGDLANWSRGNEVGGIGGAMDLALGAKKVIVAMRHTTKNGRPKIVNKCSMPLTALQCVNTIVTDHAVLEVTPKGLVLKRTLSGMSLYELRTITEPYIHPF